MKRLFIIVGIILIPLIPVVLLLTGVIKRAPTTVNRVSLTMWITDDEVSAFNDYTSRFSADYPYVTISVKKIRSEDYHQSLLEAWAQGKGPDIFFVPSNWIGDMQPYAAPMPVDLTVPVVKTKKNFFGPQTTVTSPVVKAPSLTLMREWYVDAAATDIIRGTQIWALPLSMDTIVTYSNKDLLNNARIFEPAKTWTELVNQISQQNLTIIDQSGAIIQSGTALGTANNVPYATDLLSLIMMQNGSAMVDSATKKAKFSDDAGVEALRFYSSFAQPRKETYSWNADQPNALDSFLKGKVAYYFGTYSDRKKIAASGLKWSVSPMLHLDKSGDKNGRFVDATRYTVGMVSKSAANSKRSVTAWTFLRFMANSDNVPTYLKTTNRLSALKTVLQVQRKDETKAIFAEQMLTTRTWYRGTGAQKADQALADAITSVVKDGEDPKAALQLAGQLVETTL